MPFEFAKRLFGAAEMKARILKAALVGPKRVGEALFEEMGVELKEVVKRTPKASGDLRASEKRLGPFMDGSSIIVLIVAGGPDVPYAMIVHEDLDAIHPIGQAKYIESVLLESRSFIAARVARRINIADWVN